MKTYKMSKGWAIFIYVAAPLLMALFGWILIMPFFSTPADEINPKVYWVLAPMSLGMMAFMVVALIDTIKGKFVIDQDKVFTVSTFVSRQLMFDEIKGYRITDQYIFIEPKNEHKKRIKISTYLGKTDEIVAWLSQHYPDLDVLQADQEEKEILNNKDYGWTSEQRAERLAKAHQVAKILNWTGGLVGAWTLFLARPYEYAIMASIAVPILCIIALKYFNGLIRADEKKHSAYPSIFWAIFASSMGLCLRGLIDYNIFDYAKIWTPVLLISIVFTGVIIGNKEFKFNKTSDYVTIAVFLLFLSGYGYGAIVTLNCMYDQSEPEIFNATVLNKRVSSGKSTTYYVALTPWGKQKEVEEVSISKELYKRLDKNDEVNIYFMKGYFDIPWFEVTE